MSESIPKFPTHAVHFVDNSQGERDLYVIFAYKVGAEYFCHDNGKPLLEYVGDEILQVWPLELDSERVAPAPERLRTALIEATDILERELLPTLEEPYELERAIERFRGVAAGSADGEANEGAVFKCWCSACSQSE